MEEKKLTEEQARNVHLWKLLHGEILGPLTGKPSQDKPHIAMYPKKALEEDRPHMTMYEYLCESCKNNLDDVAIVFDPGMGEVKITYRKLLENIDKVADRLYDAGITEGDMVAISMANTPESVYLIYALNKLGSIVCLLDPRSKEFALERDLKELNAKAYIGINESYKKIKKVSKNVDLDRIIIASPLESFDKKLPKFLYITSKMFEGNAVFNVNRKWSNFLSENRKVGKAYVPPYKEGELAILAYTGGTTGVHKGVKLSNDCMNNLIFAHKYLVDLDRGEKFMNILPQFMIYGAFTLHLALCSGYETHLLIDSSPKGFVDNLIRINPAIVFGGPIHWETLIDNPKLTAGSLSNMKAPVSGGEKLPLAKEIEIDKALEAAGSSETLWNGYGASEVSGSSTIKKGKRNKTGSVGSMHIFDNAKIVDPETYEELPYNQVGEFLITSPSLMLEYYNNEEESKKAIVVDEDGTRWFATGDLASIDENGDITITGRIKRLFVCGVNNVYPAELEEIISTIPNVKKCAITNVPDDELREVPKAHLVLEEDTEKNRKDAIDAISGLISERIGTEVLPHYYEFHDDLLYTASGKIDYTTLRKGDLEKVKTEPKQIKIKK